MEKVTNFTLTYEEVVSQMSKQAAVASAAAAATATLSGKVQEEEAMEDWLGPVISITVPILFALIVIVGLVGNSLVVIVVKCNPQMCSTTNLLIINLAVADLLFIIFCVPFTAWDYAFPYWPFGGIWCKVVQYLIVVCAYASIYTVSSKPTHSGTFHKWSMHC